MLIQIISLGTAIVVFYGSQPILVSCFYLISMRYHILFSKCKLPHLETQKKLPAIVFTFFTASIFGIAGIITLPLLYNFQTVVGILTQHLSWFNFFGILSFYLFLLFAFKSVRHAGITVSTPVTLASAFVTIAVGMISCWNSFALLIKSRSDKIELPHSVSVNIQVMILSMGLVVSGLLGIAVSRYLAQAQSIMTPRKLSDAPLIMDNPVRPILADEDHSGLDSLPNDEAEATESTSLLETTNRLGSRLSLYTNGTSRSFYSAANSPNRSTFNENRFSRGSISSFHTAKSDLGVRFSQHVETHPRLSVLSASTANSRSPHSRVFNDLPTLSYSADPNPASHGQPSAAFLVRTPEMSPISQYSSMYSVNPAIFVFAKITRELSAYKRSFFIGIGSSVCAGMNLALIWLHFFASYLLRLDEAQFSQKMGSFKLKFVLTYFGIIGLGSLLLSLASLILYFLLNVVMLGFVWSAVKRSPMFQRLLFCFRLDGTRFQRLLVIRRNSSEMMPTLRRDSEDDIDSIFRYHRVRRSSDYRARSPLRRFYKSLKVSLLPGALSGLFLLASLFMLAVLTLNVLSEDRSDFHFQLASYVLCGAMLLSSLLWGVLVSKELKVDRLRLHSAQAIYDASDTCMGDVQSPVNIKTLSLVFIYSLFLGLTSLSLIMLNNFGWKWTMDGAT